MTTAAVTPEVKPEVKKGPTKEQEAQATRIMEGVANRKQGPTNVDFKLTYDMATSKLIMHGQTLGADGKPDPNALPWPQISIGKKAGIVIDDLRSYPEDGVRTAYDAAIEGDTRLAAQNGRAVKKAQEAAKKAAAPAGETQTVAANEVGTVEEVFETGSEEEAEEAETSAA